MTHVAIFIDKSSASNKKQENNVGTQKIIWAMQSLPLYVDCFDLTNFTKVELLVQHMKQMKQILNKTECSTEVYVQVAKNIYWAIVCWWLCFLYLGSTLVSSYKNTKMNLQKHRVRVFWIWPGVMHYHFLNYVRNSEYVILLQVSS